MSGPISPADEAAVEAQRYADRDVIDTTSWQLVLTTRAATVSAGIAIGVHDALSLARETMLLEMPRCRAIIDLAYAAELTRLAEIERELVGDYDAAIREVA